MAGDLRINAALLAGPGEFILFFVVRGGGRVNVGVSRGDADEQQFQTEVSKVLLLFSGESDSETLR